MPTKISGDAIGHGVQYVHKFGENLSVGTTNKVVGGFLVACIPVVT